MSFGSMSSERDQLAKTKEPFQDATNNRRPCPWSRCPDNVLAANRLLYSFDLRDDNRRSSALLWACCLSKPATARRALEAGADPNAEWPGGMWELLERYSPKFDPSRGASTKNALCVVASLGDVAMASLLIDFARADFSRPVRVPAEPAARRRVCPGQPVRYDDPPIFSAVSMDRAELLCYFLQRYGDNVRDLSGNTLLTRAVREQRPAAVRALLRDESYTDPLGTGDVNGLIQAVHRGDAGLVRLILAKSRSDPNVIRDRDDDSRCHSGIRGQTPLVIAVCQGHEGVVRALCADPRVDVNLHGPNHRAPIFYALTQFRWEIVGLLVERGAAYDAELAFEQACLNRQLGWMTRLIRTTTFDETRLDYWYRMGRSLLKDGRHWSAIEPELDKKRDVYTRSWRGDKAFLWTR
ncbi:ankyrin repeat-containing protein [Cordyceps javanica]|uniref:Ankyrin repeat-containing protein n=1 Tax=Cordyceps javanica TaxID=43265 RepID=A0A545WEM3_9HYPO|nr:ankyrin repeat-containing protein [Cordyceps javanica]TQW12392.1 ankyrin repeat-containing protein [Cordyceps javanica]